VIDINETIKTLCRKYSAFSGRVQHDVSARGENFATLTMPNEKNPKFPMTVMLYEKGYALVSVGNCGEALSCESESALIETVQNILADKVYFTLQYKSEADFDVCRVCASRIDTDEGEYEKYIASLERRVTVFEKLLGTNTGVFETTNFGGGSYRIILRGVKEIN
jgi:hypothetical protein